MSTSTLEIRKGTTVVHLNGPAVIDTAGTLHQIFLQTIENRLPVVMELANISECDSTFVQLVASLCRALQRQGNTLSPGTSTVPESVRQLIAALGFECKNDCTHVTGTKCFLSTAAGQGKGMSQ